MAEAFDAYYKWLAIPPDEQPPHHYRLLGVKLFEADSDVLASAADQRMAHLRTFQTGKQAALSQRLLNEISAARLCLLQPARKADYDRQLQASLQAAAGPAAAPPPTAAPPATVPPAAVPLAPAPPPLPTQSTAAPLAATPTVAAGPAVPLPTPSGRIPALRPVPIAVAPSAESSRMPIVADERPSSAARRSRKQQRSWLGLVVPLAVVGLAAVIGLVIYLKSATPEVASKPTSSKKSKGAEHHPKHKTETPKSKVVETPAENPPVETAKSPATPDPESVATVEAPAATPRVTPPTSDESPLKPKPKAKPKAADEPSADARKLLDRVAQHMSEGSVLRTAPAGGSEGEPFEELPRGGGLLVGLNIALAEAGEVRTIRAVQAAYQTAQGISLGEPHGHLGTEFVSLRAKPGYAVGQILLRADQRVEACQLVYMRIRPEGLNVRSVYKSQWVGGDEDPDATVLGEDGRAVIGIYGSADGEVQRLGLILDDEPIRPLATTEPDSPPAKSPATNKPALPPKNRTAAPSDDKQKEWQAEIRELFKDDYTAAAKGAKQRMELARKLYLKGNDTTDNPEARYVLLVEARDLFARIGDSQGVVETILLLAGNYQIDDVGMTLTYLEKAAEAAGTPLPWRRRLIENCLSLIDKAIEQDNYDAAEQLVTIGKKGAPKAQDSISAARLNWRAARLHDQKTAFEAIAEPLEVLKTQPDNEAANLAVGRYRACFQDDWRAGLPLLAKGSDDALRQLARQELADPQTAAEQLKLAEAWEALAKTDDAHRGPFERRARHWYQRATPELHGLILAKATKKLDELRGGRGLKAEFFRGHNDFKDAAISSRIDPNIDFTWRQSEPAEGVPADDFSARWSGWIAAPANGTYQLTLQHDDGARLWIDNRMVIDKLSKAGTDSAMVPFAGKARQIRVELYQFANEAKIILKWAQKDGFAEQVVPPEAFYETHAGASKGFAPLANPPYKDAFSFRLPQAQRPADGPPAGE